MRVRLLGFAATVLAFGMAAQTASACLTCKRTPCVMTVQPAYECVTEMVPYTVMKKRVRTEYQTVEKTVMVRQPILQTVERQRVVCRPVYDTTYVQQRYQVTRQVVDTTYVDQPVTVCRPVSTTRQVAVNCVQPVSQVVTRPATVKHHGLHGLCQALGGRLRDGGGNLLRADGGVSGRGGDPDGFGGSVSQGAGAQLAAS